MERLRDAFIIGNRRFSPPESRFPTIAWRISLAALAVAHRPSAVLRCNGINTRHYALTPDGEALHSNASIWIMGRGLSP